MVRGSRVAYLHCFVKEYIALIQALGSICCNLIAKMCVSLKTNGGSSSQTMAKMYDPLQPVLAGPWLETMMVATYVAHEGSFEIDKGDKSPVGDQSPLPPQTPSELCTRMWGFHYKSLHLLVHFDSHIKQINSIRKFVLQPN